MKLFLPLTAFALILVAANVTGLKRMTPKTKLKKVPVAPGAWPLFGHWPQMAENTPEFFEKCYRTCGKVFIVNLGRKKCLTVADRDLLKDVYRATESNISLYNYMDASYLSRGFSPTTNPFTHLAPLMRKVLFGPSKEIMTVTDGYMKRYLESYMEGKHDCDSINIDELFRSTFHRAFYKAAFDLDATPALFKAFDRFVWAFKCVHISFYVMPGRILCWLAEIALKPRRDAYVKLLLPIVLKYYNAESERGANFIRVSVEHISEDLGRALTPTEICETILGVHFAMLASPMATAAQVLKELSARPLLWKQVQQELKNAATEEILASKTLNACFLESVRVNPSVIPIFRSVFPHSEFAGLDLNGIDYIVIPGFLLLNGSLAEPIYPDASEYKPERFLAEVPDSMGNRQLFYWGSGVHACPGRTVAIHAGKVAVANVVKAFDAKLVSVSKKNFFSILATGDQEIQLALRRT